MTVSPDSIKPNDPLAERIVLAGILKYGREGFDEAELTLYGKETFTESINKDFYNAVKSVYSRDEQTDTVTVADLSSEFHSMGIKNIPMDYYGMLRNMPVASIAELRKYASVASKLHIARQIGDKLEDSARKVRGLSGQEKLEQIIGVVEGPLNNLYDTLYDKEDVCSLIHEGVDEHLDALENNPVDQIGVPTGFPLYDAAIGGGIARKTVNIIGARLKVGKSMLLTSMAKNISFSGIPCLNLDTEMHKGQQLNRVLANISGVDMNLIKTGKYVNTPSLRSRVREASEELKKVPYRYQNISGWEFEDILSAMKRWVRKFVGQTDGVTNDCVIFYDYIKLMNTGELNNLAEFQMLGFMMTQLHNFMVKNDVGSVAFCQLNRDGIDGDSTATFAGSDRIGWLCTSMATLKEKNEDELAETGKDGNLKLTVLAARDGMGTPGGKYINIIKEGNIAKMSEGGIATSANDTFSDKVKGKTEKYKKKDKDSQPDFLGDAPF